MSCTDLLPYLIDSCKAYYNFLSERNRGFERVMIENFEILSHTVRFQLRSSVKFFEFAQLEINDQEQALSDVFSQAEYDEAHKVLLCKRTDALTSLLSTVTSGDKLYITSNMKFLIKRLQNRYSFMLEHKIPLLKTNRTSSLPSPACSSFLSAPSPEQADAINTVFTQPLSYIWGAPGTGKTKFVLANSVVHYIKNRKPVLLVAPTNTALEQMLSGIITVLDAESCLADEQILLRLGTPTTTFLNKYPSYCELHGLAQKVERIQSQITLLKNVSIKLKAENQLVYLTDIVEKIKYILSLKDKISDNKQKLELLDHHFRVAEAERLAYAEMIKKTSKVLYSLNPIYIFYRKIKAITPNTLQQLELALATVTSEQQKISNQIDALHTASTQANTEIYDILQALITSVSKEEKLKPLLILIKQQQLSPAVDYINDIISNYQPSVTEFFNKHPEYKHKTSESIEYELNKLSNKEKELQEYTLASRIKHSLVVACTIDTLISRLSPDIKIWEELDSAAVPFRPAHIFLDEASFCSLIKSVVLFNFDCPVSLFGDHMQLPPVVEANESDMKKNSQFQSIFLWNMPSIYVNNLFTTTPEELFSQYNSDKIDAPDICTVPLTNTYRFGASLADVLCKYVYHLNFTSAAGYETAVYFIDVKAQPVGKRGNQAEVDAISKLVSDFSADDFAILTPYKNQVELLKQQLPELFHSSKILTVHKSQGQEWDTVILSVSDNAQHRKWFTSSRIKVSQGLQLINTAISRAKLNLIIVCDYDYWISQEKELITELLKIGKPYKNNLS